MSEHTPGPWEPCILDMPLSDIPAYVEKCIAVSGGKNFYFISGQREDGPVDICHVGNGPRGEANTRLIAAAPGLLEALEAMCEYTAELDFNQGFDGNDPPAVNKAREAIMKAKGEA